MSHLNISCSILFIDHINIKNTLPVDVKKINFIGYKIGFLPFMVMGLNIVQLFSYLVLFIF